MAELKERITEFLDRRDAVYTEDNFSGLADMFVFPHVIVTRAAVMIIEDEDRLREGYDAWMKMLTTQHVTDVIHSVSDATALENDLVSARWKTHLLRGANPVCPPYKSSATFRNCEDGKLRAVSVTMGIRNLSWPITIPRVDGDGETLE